MYTPEIVAPHRLEELLAGALPETDAEARLEGLVRALHSAAPRARTELRERIRSLAAPSPRRPLHGSRRRLALAISLVLLLAAASIVAALRIASSHTATADRGTLATVRGLVQRRATPASPPFATVKPILAAPLLAPRAQHVDTWIELRVRDADRLSSAANDAMSITRELGGYAASSTVGTRGSEGQAELALRLPVAKVDDALFRLSQLGTITGQRVVTSDRQAAIDSSSHRIEVLREAIRIAQLRLQSGTLDAKGRLQLQIKLERLRRRLATLASARARLVREAATADLTLVLHTRPAASSQANENGVGGVVGDALHVLGRAGEVALFVAIVASPIVLLALLLWLVRRRRLQAEEAQLLDHSRPGAPSPQPPSPAR